MPDYFQPDAMLLSRFRCVRSGVAMLDIGHFYRATRYLLYLLGKRSGLFAVAPVSGLHDAWSNASTDMWAFEPLHRFAPS